MGERLTAADLFQMFSALLRSKEQIYSVLRRIDIEELESGILGLHQDIFNDSLKQLIKNRMEIEDLDVRFSGDCVRVTADKFIKAMMFEKVIRIKVKFYNIDLIFANGQYFLTTDYLTEFEGIPPIVEKMPGGGALREMIINSAIRHLIKDAEWIDIRGERIYIDFSRIGAFAKLRQTGVFGVDVINDVELTYIGTKNGELQLAYRTK